jgi:hypothetical protein
VNRKRETVREREHRHDRELATAFHHRRRAALGLGYQFRPPARLKR